MHALVFNCGNPPGKSDWSVHDISFFARAISPEIVGGSQTFGTISGTPVVRITFESLAAGAHTFEVKIRWLDKSYRIKGTSGESGLKVECAVTAKSRDY